MCIQLMHAGRMSHPAIVEEIGAEKTGFRISPGTPLGRIQDGEQTRSRTVSLPCKRVSYTSNCSVKIKY
ncbi:hypothetical protein PAECIP111894_03530 [Paenibacillus pseudetheri]|uniref:Uncharacterized protein n=2 Tax=Paenibacillus pseudetheri TaxID=2897682 RepID=A0ABM9BEX4_9BACL|nr:hypothetical protein PAECIP111894_03530 [Paenibacillus pseudetheri]